MAKDQSDAARKAAKAERALEKTGRTHADRAMASLRAAKRGQREVSEPTERARFLLAEAHVLVLLDLAEALSGSSFVKSKQDGHPSSPD
jgi:hypothetical protein